MSHFPISSFPVAFQVICATDSYIYLLRGKFHWASFSVSAQNFVVFLGLWRCAGSETQGNYNTLHERETGKTCLEPPDEICISQGLGYEQAIWGLPEVTELHFSALLRSVSKVRRKKKITNVKTAHFMHCPGHSI